MGKEHKVFRLEGIPSNERYYGFTESREQLQALLDEGWEIEAATPINHSVSITSNAYGKVEVWGDIVYILSRPKVDTREETNEETVRRFVENHYEGVSDMSRICPICNGIASESSYLRYRMCRDCYQEGLEDNEG